ncbi:MAG: phytanoyl-CoA dioxygenase family protein, partial [Pseudomonadota bacterium]|nr:phytanoyl-CoA dioxygenase family protein [Pseudomonadota bacterium]
MSAPQRECLTDEQVSFYNETGYLVLENHLDTSVIQDIRDEIARLESLAHGMTESDDRLDLEDSHTPDTPRVRRIKLPHTQSDVVKNLLYSDQVLGPVRDLIGPDLRLHTTKLNMKSAEYG